MTHGLLEDLLAERQDHLLQPARLLVAGQRGDARSPCGGSELDPLRRIDVDWDPGAAVPWSIRVRVVSLDRPGLLAKVTKTISAAGINIGAANVTTSPDLKALHTFDLWVTDVEMLNSVMREIGRIKGVLSVERLRA